MDYKTPSVLVTGAGGYVGSQLCRDLLRMNYRVRAMDNFYKGNSDSLIELCSYDNFEFIQGDVTKIGDVKKAVEGVDYIVHLAGIVGFPACERNPQLSWIVNVAGTINVVDHKNDARLLFASTGSVYGKIDGFCDENSPLNPQSEYGEHKLEAEDVVRQAENSVSYRFATGFGVSPNMRVNLLINDLTYQAYIHKCITIFEPDARRTFIHVRDMCNAFVFGIKNMENFKYTVYNVGSEENNWTKREVAEYIKTKTGALVTYAEINKDKDTRDYEVSYKRINEEGWHAPTTVFNGVNELMKSYTPD